MIDISATTHYINILRRTTRILLTALVATSILFASTASAVTGSTGGRPAYPREDNKRTRSIFVHTLDQGQSADEGILVVNNSDKTQTVSLYAVDGTITSSGSLTCRQRVEERKDVGSWVNLSKSTVTLAPGTDEIVDFTITVPRGVVDVGEHNGCMVIEPVAQTDTEGDTGGVRIRTRSAIRIAVTIPGELKKELTFNDFKIRYDKGNYQYDISIKNVGNVSLDTDIAIKMTSLFGDDVYHNGGQYPVIPRSTLDLTFTNENPPMFGGWYWVDATIQYDAAISNGIGEVANPDLVTKNWDRQLIFVSPTFSGLLIIIAVIALLGAAPAYLTYQIMRRKRVLRAGKKHYVNGGETLRSIAELHGISWKTLANLNKIKPPYDVKPGTALFIPQKANRKTKVNSHRRMR